MKKLITAGFIALAFFVVVIALIYQVDNFSEVSQTVSIAQKGQLKQVETSVSESQNHQEQETEVVFRINPKFGDGN